MRSRSTWIVFVAIIALTALSFIVVWPSAPSRYLGDFIPWPEGRGIKITVPTIEGGNFGTTVLERRAMSLGLDLRGGTRLVLAPEENAQIGDLDAALEGARDIIERRVNEFGVAEAEVNRLGNDRIAVQLPGISPEEAIEKIGRTALLQFCQPIIASNGDVAIRPEGATVRYEPQTCEPEAIVDAEGTTLTELARDEDGVVQPTSGELEFAAWPLAPDDIVWQPARAEVEGEILALDGTLMRNNTFVIADAVGQPILSFEFTNVGAEISGIVTEILAQRQYPIAPFLDGKPILSETGRIIAPNVQSQITARGQISGLSFTDARELSTLLNIGAFPVPLQVIQQQSVDATLGDTAVRNSVVAGIIGLLLIMLFMVLYYRLPGLMAALALIVYTSFVLAIFKLWPVTLTLAGVAAFILSVGMAIDANILIFERMKEELRVGRSLMSALEDGFNRAWSSIRDSNISTLITCAILYWFGDQFNESAIKGFAITLAIGVSLSMFSAITVSRTFMRLAVSWRPLSRRLWLFAPDLDEHAGQPTRRTPAIAGGSGSERPEER